MYTTMELPIPDAWTAAIDYLRLTYKGGRNEGLESNVIRAYERIGSETVQGLYKWEEWKWFGYRGKRLGACAYGWSDAHGYIYQASGISAAEVFDLRLPYTNCPRLDIQVTAWYSSPQDGIAETCASLSDVARNGFRGRPWRIRHVKGHGNGDTCYIGSRGKETFFIRDYNKEGEAPGVEEYKGAWRYEVELTDRYAVDAMARLESDGASHENVAAMVASYHDLRGIPIAATLRADTYVPYRPPREEGSVERRLRWLREQVRPSIDKLIADGVSLSLISEALGFTSSNAGV